MTTEAGHHASRFYRDQDGNVHLNGASFFNDAEADIANALEALGTVSATELGYIDGVTPGTATASQAVVADANIDVAGLRNVTATGAIKSSGATGGVGYATGAGGAVTQLTNAATGVTLNKICGQITTVALTTAAGAEERFTVTNSAVAATDVVVLGTTYNGGGTVGLSVQKIAAGAFDIVITNLHASAAFDALMVINFVVLKGVAA